MSKPPRFQERTKLTLQGEKAHIAEAHIYAGRKDRSLSAMFFDWVLPKIMKDKAKSPEAYEQRQEASK